MLHVGDQSTVYSLDRHIQQTLFRIFLTILKHER